MVDTDRIPRVPDNVSSSKDIIGIYDDSLLKLLKMTQVLDMQSDLVTIIVLYTVAVLYPSCFDCIEHRNY